MLILNIFHSQESVKFLYNNKEVICNIDLSNSYPKTIRTFGRQKGHTFGREKRRIFGCELGRETACKTGWDNGRKNIRKIGRETGCEIGRANGRENRCKNGRKIMSWTKQIFPRKFQSAREPKKL